MYEDTRKLIDESKELRLSIHENGKTQARLRRDMEVIKAELQSRVSANKELSNETKRKAALTELLSTDSDYLTMQDELDASVDKAALVNIELRYLSDLIQLNLVVAAA